MEKVFGRRPDGRITGEAVVVSGSVVLLPCLSLQCRSAHLSEAYVMFRSIEEAEHALNSLQNRALISTPPMNVSCRSNRLLKGPSQDSLFKEIQGRYIELFRSTEALLSLSSLSSLC